MTNSEGTNYQLPRRAPARGISWVRDRVLVGIWVLGVAICAASLAGCAKAQAKNAPDGPPLEMPEPPPRVLAPVDEPMPAAASPPETAQPTPPRNIPRQTPRDGGRNETQKPVEQPPPVEPPLPQAAPPDTKNAESARLSTPGTTGATEKPIRDRLTGAARDLSRVDYGKLSEDGRTQYEQSKRFIQQAEQALKDQNFVFAATLADKAATLAAELLGR
jgi:hypothetical protein